MKKIKFLFTAFAAFLLVGVAGVSAEEYSADYQKLTSDGKITISFMNNDPRDWHLQAHLDALMTDNYSFHYTTCNDDFTMCSISLIYNDGSLENETHDIQISYKEVYSDNFKKLTNDGKLTVKTKIIDNPQDWLYRYLSSYNTKDYSFNLGDCNPDYSLCSISGLDSLTGTFEQHNVAITYEEEYSDTFKALAPNNKMTIPVMNFNGNGQALSDYFVSLNADNNSYNYSDCNEDYTICSVEIMDSNFIVIERHKVQFTYKETYSNEFKSILTDGKLVIKESNLSDDKIEIIRNSVSKFNNDKYSFNVDSCNADYTNCRINRHYNYGTLEQHDVDIIYNEEYSEEFKKLSKDGKLVINSSTIGEKENLVREYLNGLWTTDISFNVSSCNEDATKCAVTMFQNNPYRTETHVMNFVYEEKYSDAFKNVITDGKIVVNSIQPKDPEQSDFFLQNYLNNISSSKREYWVGTCNEDYTICDITASTRGKDDAYITETHKANITYAKIDTNKQTQVNKVLASLPENKTFAVEDLEMINYLVNSGYASEENYYSAESVFMNYSSELKKALGNSNITASLDIRGGEFSIFVNDNIGGYIVSYDGVAYGSFQGGATKKYVIYIPDETEDTHAAYIKAAEDRVSKYLGHNKVKFTYAGKLSELEESDHEELGLGDKLRDEYYTLTYNDMMVDFLIVKDSSKMKDIGEQSTNDVMTNISISMNSPVLPLDTSIMVDEIEKDSQKYTEITNKLSDYNTNNALVYDLKLYSSSNRDYITKLDNGLFEVKIPISKELEGKDLIVYYVNENGKVDKHDVDTKSIKGYAVFTTDHFSIYTLAEMESTIVEPEIENPNTYDGILTYYVIGLVSLIGLCVLGVYSNKLNGKKDY